MSVQQEPFVVVVKSKQDPSALPCHLRRACPTEEGCLVVETQTPEKGIKEFHERGGKDYCLGLVLVGNGPYKKLLAKMLAQNQVPAKLRLFFNPARQEAPAWARRFWSNRNLRRRTQTT